MSQKETAKNYDFAVTLGFLKAILTVIKNNEPLSPGGDTLIDDGLERIDRAINLFCVESVTIDLSTRTERNKVVSLCPHNQLYDECEECFRQSDEAFDAAREQGRL